VGGASIRFKTYTGKIAGFTYSNYQNTAWGTAWQSRADGTMPSDGGGLGVKVPAAQCDLIVSNGGYVGVVVSNVFAGAPAAGVQTNLGTVWLRPVDGNGNGIADDWEAKHFPGGMGSPTNDTDHDGSPDGDEYGAGTDPTNAASVLGFDGSVSNLTDGFRVEWDSVPWHTYRVRGTNDLMGAWPWPALSPDLEATQAQYRMSWLDASATGKVQRFYRVDAVLP
jgi:hypothetical protein